jgi:hypothetical protein
MADLFRVIFGRVLGRSVLNPITGLLFATLTDGLRLRDIAPEFAGGMLFEDGDRMLFEDADVMQYEGS